jgi:acyl-CoA thioesterase YciA
MELISTKICKTSDIGVNDNLFGGVMLQWIDEAGGVMASSLCCTPNMITLKMDEVVFKLPVKVKEHIRIYGKVDNVGTSSLRLSIEARRFDFASHKEELVCSTKILFVKINSEGKATPIGSGSKERIMKIQSHCKND